MIHGLFLAKMIHGNFILIFFQNKPHQSMSKRGRSSGPRVGESESAYNRRLNEESVRAALEDREDDRPNVDDVIYSPGSEESSFANESEEIPDPIQPVPAEQLRRKDSEV